MVRAIICDDEDAAINIIRHFINNTKLPVEIVGTAKNGKEALTLLKKEKPDLAFMDIQMPFMNGLEVLEQAGDCKVIIITAFDSFEYAQKALRLGACDIMAKPIDFEQLKDAINRAVGWKFTGNNLANTILEYIHAHYKERIELADLADLTFCTESHIARSFKKHTGTTVLSYMHKLRVEESIRLMVEQQYTVGEAAEAVGYQNMNHFYKYFKLHTGVTPAMYVKSKK